MAQGVVVWASELGQLGTLQLLDFLILDIFVLFIEHKQEQQRLCSALSQWAIGS